MRVLQVVHTAQPGGATEVAALLAEHAFAPGEQACVFLEDGPAVARLLAAGVPTAVVPAGRAREPWKAPAAIRSLRAATDLARADVVLAHVSKAALYAGPAASLAGRPFVWWQHEHLGLKPRMQALAGRVPAAAVICSSDWVAGEQRRRFPDTPVHRVHPGLAPRPDLPAHTHRAAGRATGDAVVVGVAGRLVRWKRVDLTIRAFEAVRAALPGARLRIVGGSTPGVDEGYESELRDLAAGLGIAGSLEWAGHRPDGRAAIQELDVLVHCARREPFGLAPAEALSVGVPVIAAAEGGPREVVRDGVDGLLVDVTDRDALAAAVIALAGDPDRRAALGRRGCERVLRELGVAAMAAATRAILVAAISSGGPPRRHRRVCGRCRGPSARP